MNRYDRRQWPTYAENRADIAGWSLERLRESEALCETIMREGEGPHNMAEYLRAIRDAITDMT